MEDGMGVRVVEGSTSSRYVLDPYFPAIAIVGEEQDGNTYVGFYRGEYDLVELWINSYTGAVGQVILTGCRHYCVTEEPMAVPGARDGVLTVDMPLQNECEKLRVTCFSDGVLVRVVDGPPARHVRCGDVVFGVTSGGGLSEILLTSMTPEEAAHARSVLMGVGFEGDFEPMEE